MIAPICSALFDSYKFSIPLNKECRQLISSIAVTISAKKEKIVSLSVI